MLFILNFLYIFGMVGQAEMRTGIMANKDKMKYDSVIQSLLQQSADWRRRLMNTEWFNAIQSHIDIREEIQVQNIVPAFQRMNLYCVANDTGQSATWTSFNGNSKFKILTAVSGSTTYSGTFLTPSGNSFTGVNGDNIIVMPFLNPLYVIQESTIAGGSPTRVAQTPNQAIYSKYLNFDDSFVVAIFDQPVQYNTSYNHTLPFTPQNTPFVPTINGSKPIIQGFLFCYAINLTTSSGQYLFNLVNANQNMLSSAQATPTPKCAMFMVLVNFAKNTSWNELQIASIYTNIHGSPMPEVAQQGISKDNSNITNVYELAGSESSSVQHVDSQSIMDLNQGSVSNNGLTNVYPDPRMASNVGGGYGANTNAGTGQVRL